MKEKNSKTKDKLTERVLRQDLTFERTGENKITRPFVSKGRARRILRMLRKNVVVLTVVRDGTVISKGYVNREGLETTAEVLALKYKVSITYNALKEVRIVLSQPGRHTEGHAAG